MFVKYRWFGGGVIMPSDLSSLLSLAAPNTVIRENSAFGKPSAQADIELTVRGTYQGILNGTVHRGNAVHTG